MLKNNYHQNNHIWKLIFLLILIFIFFFSTTFLNNSDLFFQFFINYFFLVGIFLVLSPKEDKLITRIAFSNLIALIITTYIILESSRINDPSSAILFSISSIIIQTILVNIYQWQNINYFIEEGYKKLRKEKKYQLLFFGSWSLATLFGMGTIYFLIIYLKYFSIQFIFDNIIQNIISVFLIGISSLLLFISLLLIIQANKLQSKFLI